MLTSWRHRHAGRKQQAQKAGEMIFLLVAGALIVGAPILAAILVSVASLREDARHSLAGHPPGRLAAAVRRLLCVRTDGARVAGPRRAARVARNGTPPYVPGPRLHRDEQADHVVPVLRP